MSVPTPLPEGVVLTWYGDDFTGAAAVMEVLTFAGLPAALFLDVPNSEQMARFPDVRAVGIASTARTRSPDWMEDTLPSVFEALGALSDGPVHYKVCTTLDSSPTTGSIGKAIEIGARAFACDCVPVLIAAPQMRRFQYFGHLFAAAGATAADRVHRLDRHPVMSRHPVTPMAESDVAAHLARQSAAVSMGCIDVEALAEPGLSLTARRDPDRAGPQALTIDSIDADTETAAGALIWNARDRCRFVVGSQGVEYALVRHWRATGALPDAPAVQGIGRTDRMAVVSGSVSGVTQAQIAWSREHGFDCVRFDVQAVFGDERRLADEVRRAVSASMACIDAGRIPLVYTADGPDDPFVVAFDRRIESEGADGARLNRRVGESLGTILQRLIERTGITRAVISGGDTSGHATQRLGVFALTALAPTIPGAAIFRAHADGDMDGLELALKGGQMGSPDYFGWIRDGGGPR